MGDCPVHNVERMLSDVERVAASIDRLSSSNAFGKSPARSRATCAVRAFHGQKLKQIVGGAMAKTRRYSIEVRDAKSKAVVVSAAIDWTSDDKQVAVTQIFRLPGFADSRGITHRLSQKRGAKRNAAIAKKQPRTPPT